MSHLVLSRVMVRMLYDPEFTARVLEAPDAALAGLDLTADERSWLRQPDPRAWRTEPERTDRSMQALLQQYPASTALAVRATGERDPFRPFLRSARFHDAVQTRGSLALAFAGHLLDRVEAGEIADRRVDPMARLEREIVEVHRHAPARPPAAGPGASLYVLSPDKRLHTAEAGTADLHEAIHVALAGPDLARAVLEEERELPALPIRRGKPEPLLLELARHDGPRVQYAVAATEITAPLYALLDHARTPRRVEDLRARVERLGAGPQEAPEIIAGLIEDATLVPAE